MLPRTSRRSLLKAGGSLAIAGVLVPSGASATADARLRALERTHQARLGVYARNLRTGHTVSYRAGERFPMCSVFKGLAVGHVLRDYDRCGAFLDRVVHYAADDLVDHSPVTSQHVATGMPVRDLSAAALIYSDNTAANLILQITDGPRGVTRFCRSIGDPYTRLDRNEPDVNTAIPGDPRDTTTPAAIGRTYGRLLVGHALPAPDRRQLVNWMKANTTSAEQFRAGLPGDWVIADKTGSGDYGCTNDVGVAWTSTAVPIVFAVLSVKRAQAAAVDYPLIADTARILARELAPGQ
jgi:beta-lactamase class A